MKSGRSARRQALLIVGTVAAYTVVEVALLLGFLPCVTPSDIWSPDWYRIVVSYAQLLLIPGIAVLFFRLIYGSGRIRGRAAAILAMGPLIAGSFVLLLVLALPLDRLAPHVPITGPAFFISLGCISMCLFFCFRWAGRQSQAVEETRWLAERAAGVMAVERKSRNRGIGWALCIPSATVLLVFLFLPEVWGILTHLSRFGADELHGYQVPTPATSIILREDTEYPDGRRSLLVGYVIRGPSFARSIFTPENRPLFSLWIVEARDYQQLEQGRNRPRLDEGEEVIVERAITVGKETITCLDYGTPYLTRNKKVPNSSVACVKCSGVSRLRANFVGERADLPAFYQMLSGIKLIP